MKKQLIITALFVSGIVHLTYSQQAQPALPAGQQAQATMSAQMGQGMPMGKGMGRGGRGMGMMGRGKGGQGRGRWIGEPVAYTIANNSSSAIKVFSRGAQQIEIQPGAKQSITLQTQFGLHDAAGKLLGRFFIQNAKTADLQISQDGSIQLITAKP